MTMVRIFLIIFSVWSSWAWCDNKKLASEEIKRFEEKFGDINPEKLKYVTSMLENQYGITKIAQNSKK